MVIVDKLLRNFEGRSRMPSKQRRTQDFNVPNLYGTHDGTGVSSIQYATTISYPKGYPPRGLDQVPGTVEQGEKARDDNDNNPLMESKTMPTGTKFINFVVTSLLPGYQDTAYSLNDNRHNEYPPDETTITKDGVPDPIGLRVVGGKSKHLGFARDSQGNLRDISARRTSDH